MRRTTIALLAGASFLTAGAAHASTNAAAQTRAATQSTARQAAVATPQELVRRVEIPYQTFTLPNGLEVVVHEDRKAPVVAVSVWYNVGSKDEPRGKTGFAHLFEHLMFNGSENAPGDFFEPLREVGATDFNGTTNFDRTNYFQTVPKPALERALFLESDRMGHLLGAVTQEKLDNQRGVVQNEKRQGDNQPYGLAFYEILKNLFPEGHPYRHSPIGSMADLDAASLGDVHQWFRDNYGPNNAVLVLAGDINAAEARPLVERYFGGIARGPVNEPAQAVIPTLPARVDQVMQDRVPITRLYRVWAVPGLLDQGSVPLQVGASVLGGLASSRLDNVLVREEQSAVSVAAFSQPFQRVGIFGVQVDVKPGQDADAVGRRVDQLIQDFIRTGPTADEVQRVATSTLAGRVRGLEQVGGFGGKAVALAEGALYADNPGFYQTQLQRLATVTPREVQATMQRWLSRPVYALKVVPGERPAYEEAGASTAGAQPRAAAPTPTPAPAPTTQRVTRQMPPVASEAQLRFPAVQRARLSNGIEVIYAQSTAVPATRVAVEFDAGIAADPVARQGTQNLMLSLMDEATTSLSSTQLAEAKERLGAQIETGASLDRTAVSLAALTPNLAPSLDLLADVIRNPAFAPSEVERLRQQQLAGIAQELNNPSTLALRALPPVLYGATSPYGRAFTGTGDPNVVQTLTRDELVNFHQRWIRPDNATIFVVSDLPLGQLTPMLEQRFGTWRAPAVPKGTKTFTVDPAASRPRIILVNRPQSPQSLILGGQVTDVKGTDDTLAFSAANEALGGSFLSRLNMDLRETRGWSYGVRGGPNLVEHNVPYIISAPVQADKTGDSIRAMQELVRSFLTSEGTTAAELNRAVLGSTRELPGRFETASSVLGALRSNELYNRPDNYWLTVSDRYRALNQGSLDQAIRTALDPSEFVWVVVGDAQVVRPQLQQLGLPIEEVQLGGPAPAAARATPAAQQQAPQQTAPQPRVQPAQRRAGERG